MKKKLLSMAIALFLMVTTLVVTGNVSKADPRPVQGVTITSVYLTVDTTPTETDKNGNNYYLFNVADYSLSFSDNKTNMSNVDLASPKVRCKLDRDGNPHYQIFCAALTKDGNSIYELSSDCAIYINGVQIGTASNEWYGFFTAEQLYPAGLTIPTEFIPASEGTIYRLLFPPTNKHLYSTDANECQALCAAGWVQETSPGISAASGVGVYRLYNPASDEHLFSADKNECDVLSKEAGWQIDNGGNPIFYGIESGTPVYRLFNPTVPTVSSHHYTSDKNEIKVLLGSGWQYDNGGNPVYYLL